MTDDLRNLIGRMKKAEVAAWKDPAASLVLLAEGIEPFEKVLLSQFLFRAEYKEAWNLIRPAIHIAWQQCESPATLIEFACGTGVVPKRTYVLMCLDILCKYPNEGPTKELIRNCFEDFKSSQSSAFSESMMDKIYRAQIVDPGGLYLLFALRDLMEDGRSISHMERRLHVNRDTGHLRPMADQVRAWTSDLVEPWIDQSLNEDTETTQTILDLGA